MRPRMERKRFSLNTSHVLFAAACLCVSALSTFAADDVSRVMLKPEVSRSHREELAMRLRAITGLPNLKFDADGSLRLNGVPEPRGSQSARALLSQAINGQNFIVIEDASSRSDVAFARVVRGRWLRGKSTNPPAYVVLMDFTDFQRLSGDAEARAAFDVGWGLLHEVDHVVRDSEDTEDQTAIGECEDHINRMRLEVGLPIRVDYFFSRAYLKADMNFSARYVRLSFERRDELALKTKRYWLVWDATTVGGLLADGQRALVR
ncbi:MAG TPA: hypothetical protein VGQ41_26270 [Pyrinomonadaceae bacterium]|nr:hypothetical protein [Pyrinomonadaceae bacterium]